MPELINGYSIIENTKYPKKKANVTVCTAYDLG